MYAALWRVLPGPIWVKIVVLIVIVAAVLAVCGLWVFPWIDEQISIQNSTIGGGA